MKALFILLIISSSAFGQTTQATGYLGKTVQASGYHATNQLDTVKAVFVVSDTSQYKIGVLQHIKGYVVRMKSVYYGDRMPGLKYEDQYYTVRWLFDNKSPLSKNYCVWLTQTN